MSTIALHREQVKAEIRMRCGSIEAFAVERGIKSQLVRDLLRGQSDTAKSAVAEFLGVPVDHLVITSGSTLVEGNSRASNGAHRLNGEVR